VRTLAFMVVRQILALAGVGPSPDAKDVEIAVLRHQLLTLCRQSSPTPLHADRPDSPRSPDETAATRSLADLPDQTLDLAALAPGSDPPVVDLLHHRPKPPRIEPRSRRPRAAAGPGEAGRRAPTYRESRPSPVAIMSSLRPRPSCHASVRLWAVMGGLLPGSVPVIEADSLSIWPRLASLAV
jgi:hypothetical protein